MAKKYVASHEQISDLLHEIGGPVSTAKGLHSELLGSAQELSDAIDKLGDAGNAGVLKSIVEDDIVHCLHHMGISLSTLQDRIKCFSDTVSVS